MLRKKMLKVVLSEKGRRSECSVYLSIVVAYLDMSLYKEAAYFLSLAKSQVTLLEEELAIELIELMLQSSHSLELEDLLKELKDL